MSKPGSFLFDWLYAGAIRTYALALYTLALLGWPAARKFLQRPVSALADIDRSGKKRVLWIHAASAGEGNQAIPIALQLKKTGNYHIIASFFSPSGFNFHKDQAAFDEVTCLPLDLGENAARFVDRIRPDLALFIRNEIWHGYLEVLSSRHIPAFLVNAPPHILAPGGWILRSYMSTCLAKFRKVYPATDREVKIQTVTTSTIIGDTKWEAAFSGAADVKDEVLSSFCHNRVCIVGGSTWPEEERLLFKWLAQNEQHDAGLILAPHDLKRVDKIALNAPVPMAVYSSYQEDQSARPVLLMDTYGMLQTAYRYARVAVIGGGFGKGVHNILEAVAAGIPVLFGPAYMKFPEASELIQAGCAFTFGDYEEMSKLLDRLTKDDILQDIQERLKPLSTKHTLLSERIARDIIRECSLPNR